MIKKEELRIGNKVNYHNDSTLFTVIEIDTLGIRVVNEEQETWIEYDCFSPIPLTPEILEKCGFVKTLSGSYTIMDEDCWLTTIIGGYIYSKCYSSNTGEFFEVGQVKYLHQLQNLYFALTGIELTIKL